MGEMKLVTQQLMRVNRWTYNEAQMYLQSAFNLWHERSVFRWEQDLSWLQSVNIELPTAKAQEWEGQPSEPLLPD